MTSKTKTIHEGEAGRRNVRPPLVLAAFLLLGSMLDHLYRLPVLIPRDEGWLHKLIPGVIVAIGLGLLATGIRGFSLGGTPVCGNRSPSALITSGIHGWSRNPIYLGMLILHGGVGVAIRSTWVLALTPLLYLILRYAVVSKEEAILERRFSDAYRRYKGRVRRWL